MVEILEKLEMPLPDIRALPSVEARLIIAFRLAVAASQNDYDCRDQLSDRLGGNRTATRIMILAETIGHDPGRNLADRGHPSCRLRKPARI